MTNSNDTYLFHATQIHANKIKRNIKRGYTLWITNHARKASQDDRYGTFNIPTKLPIRFDLIELEQRSGVDTKYVVRFAYDDTRDLILVIRPDNRRRNTYVVVTCWINTVDDAHSTLNLQRYNLPELCVYN